MLTVKSVAGEEQLVGELAHRVAAASHSGRKEAPRKLPPEPPTSTVLRLEPAQQDPIRMYREAPGCTTQIWTGRAESNIWLSPFFHNVTALKYGRKAIRETGRTREKTQNGPVHWTWNAASRFQSMWHMIYFQVIMIMMWICFGPKTHASLPSKP